MSTDSSTHAYADRIADHIALRMYHVARRRHPPRRLTALLLVLPVAALGGDAPPLHVEVAGTIAAPVAEVRGALRAIDGFGRWFPALAEWRVLGRTPDGARVYGRQALPWPIGDRDYVVRYRWSEDADGTSVVDAIAETGAAPPPPAGVVRVERLHTRWTVRAAPEGSAVTYRYEGDPGGTIPRWVARLGWRARAGDVIDALAAEVARRRTAAAASDTDTRAPP